MRHDWAFRLIGLRWTLMSSLALMLVGGVRGANHANYLVSPVGSAAGRGDLKAPWNLEYALTREYDAGDVVWLLPGTYRGVSKVGDGQSPVFHVAPKVHGTGVVTFRNWGGGRVRLEVSRMQLRSSSVVFWGMEFSDPSKTNTPWSRPGDNHSWQLWEGSGSVGLINNWFTDVSQVAGNVTRLACGNAILYAGGGCYEHVFYVGNHDRSVTPEFSGNLIHSTSGGAFKFVDGSYNLVCRSNIVVNPGVLAYPDSLDYGLYLAPDSHHSHISITDNYFLADPVRASGRDGYSMVILAAEMKSGESMPDLEFSRNVLMGNDQLPLLRVGVAPDAGSIRSLEMRGNRFIKRAGQFPWVDWRSGVLGRGSGVDANEYFSPAGFLGKVGWRMQKQTVRGLKPWQALTGMDLQSKADLSGWGEDRVVVMPNLHEPGRAHVLVINHTLKSECAVNLDALKWDAGSSMVWIPAMNLSDPRAWKTNVYGGSGQAVTVSMKPEDWPMAKPVTTVNSQPISHSLPRIGAWVVLRGPPAPQSVIAQKVSSGMELRWILSDEQFQGIVVRRRKAGSAEAFTEVGRVAPNENVWVDRNVGDDPAKWDYELFSWNDRCSSPPVRIRAH